MKAVLITSILFLIMLISCTNSKKRKIKKDSFYTDYGGFGHKRIPLVKPYEAVKVSEDEWRVELQTTQLLELSIHNVRALNVINDTIIIYAEGGEVSIKDTKYNEAWFVILPTEEIEKGFNKKEDFIAYLAKATVKDIKLYDTDKVYATFYNNKKIDWKVDF